MSTLRTFVITLLVIGLSSPGWAADQAQPAEGKAAESKPIPKAYLWSGTGMFVGGMAVGLYAFIHNKNGQFPGQDEYYATEFSLSAASREKVFHLAKDAGYFKGDFDYKDHPVASTGKKTLAFADKSRHFQTAYNYSENKSIQELTALFQGISGTIQHGRKLQFLRRFDKLGLEAELKGMEDENNSHFLAELQIISPILNTIADDSAIMNIARQRARRLLAKIGPE